MPTFNFSPRSKEEEAEIEHAEFEAYEQDEFNRRLSYFRADEGLLRIRRRFKKTQAQMADIASISRRAYQSYEQGNKDAPSSVLFRIAAHFEVDLHELVTGARSPVTDETKATLAHDAIKVCTLLFAHFKDTDMSPDEMRHISAQVLKWQHPGEKADLQLIEGAIRAVTGDKYVADDDDWAFDPDNAPEPQNNQ